MAIRTQITPAIPQSYTLRLQPTVCELEIERFEIEARSLHIRASVQEHQTAVVTYQYEEHEEHILFLLHRLQSYQHRYEVAMECGSPYPTIAHILEQLDRYAELAGACWIWGRERAS